MNAKQLSLMCAALVVTAAASSAQRTIVFDLSPFTPAGVVGEAIGAGTEQGQVVDALLEATFVSNQSGLWSSSLSFNLPTGGVGFDSASLGWFGQGTFSTSVQTDTLNGLLVTADGSPFYTWFVSFFNGTPITIPGGGDALIPIDGFYSTLRLTLTVAPCPFGDPNSQWTDLGGGLAGSTGVPVLTGTGSLCSGEEGELVLTGGLPGSTSVLFAGLSDVNAPFKGGILVPSPDILIGFGLGGTGGVTLPFAWPSGVPADFDFWVQHWVVDPLAATGFAASNALRATTP